MEKKFEPFEKVLTRMGPGKTWEPDLYSYSSQTNLHKTIGGCWKSDRDIIPFEGNEHLVGTTDEPEEEIVLKEGEFILCHDFIEMIQDGVGTLSKYVGLVVDNIKCKAGTFHYCIPMSKYNQNNLEETRKWILKVKGDKLVKVKCSQE